MAIELHIGSWSEFCYVDSFVGNIAYRRRYLSRSADGRSCDGRCAGFARLFFTILVNRTSLTCAHGPFEDFRGLPGSNHGH